MSRVAAADLARRAADARRRRSPSTSSGCTTPPGCYCTVRKTSRRARSHADARARVALAVPLRRNAGGVPLLCALAADGDAVVRARPAEIEGLRIALHGLGGGGAAAVQAALALGADAAALVLEGVPAAVRDLPGVGGLFGCCAGEPLPIQHRLGGVRCPVGVAASGPGPLDASTARAHATRILAAVTNARAKTALEPGPEVSAFISRFAVS